MWDINTGNDFGASRPLYLKFGQENPAGFFARTLRLKMQYLI